MPGHFATSITLRRELAALLTPANSNANQNSYANSDRECSKRASFRPELRNPTQSIIAGPGTDLDCLIPQAGRLVDRCALATAETIYDVVQDWPDSLGDLVARGRRASRMRFGRRFFQFRRVLFQWHVR